jgi:hypothetical protein
MPEIFKLIMDGFAKEGWWFVLQLLLLFCIFIIIALVCLWLKNKFFGSSGSNSNTNTNSVNVNFNLEEKEEIITEHTNNHLLNHPFFRSAKKMIELEIERLDIKEPLRAKIFKSFLKIKFEVTLNKIREFILAGDMNEMNSEVFHDKLYSLVTEIIQEYEIKVLADEIPQVVIDKFNKWHGGKVTTIFNFVNDICEADDWYVLNTVKFYSFLNQYVSILDLTLIDARKTLVYLNGELDKITYKGITSAFIHLENRKKSDSSGFNPIMLVQEITKKEEKK